MALEFYFSETFSGIQTSGIIVFESVNLNLEFNREVVWITAENGNAILFLYGLTKD